MNEKRCTKCGGVFPATTTYFTYQSRMLGRLSSWCKGCYRAYQKEYRRRYPKRGLENRRSYMRNNAAVHRVAEARGMLVLGRPGKTYCCPGCKEEKPRTIEYFRKWLQAPDGLDYYCNPCRKKVNAAGYAAHRTERLARMREYSRRRYQRMREQCPEKLREQWRQRDMRRKERRASVRETG